MAREIFLTVPFLFIENSKQCSWQVKDDIKDVIKDATICIFVYLSVTAAAH